ncbi:Wzz/FepE/Etk N-terminal domain-containing protein [Rhodococcus phenolicus]|uniref:Wzz/FepE/Etk N-terminal domain-containing protein n=1 Tax=Rhodococcus phenolicus TaxID=263849 RepID=UPI00083206D9|nr:Wzz/FepE/Etk N-terminal domain-containing protein [Rhodococcus phenolicus]
MTSALTEYRSVLRKRWRWVAWGVLLTVGATTVFLLLSPPIYRTQATVFVRTPGDVSRVVDGGDSYAQGRAATYAELADSTDLAARVIDDLGLGLAPEALANRIDAANRPGTALIDVDVRAPSPEEAVQTTTVLIAEFATMVRTLEEVPGALQPRAELVVVELPGPPTRIVAWNVPLPTALLAAVLAGLFLGTTAAVVRSIFDHSLHDPRDAARVSGSTLLGSIRDGAPDRVTSNERGLRLRLLPLLRNPSRGVITVTDGSRASATATTARYLARALAVRDSSVVIADLDGQRAHVIDSTEFRTRIRKLRSRYNWVILACPSATNAAALADVSDAIVLTVRQGVTTRRQLRDTAMLLPKSVASAVVFDRGVPPLGDGEETE